MKLDKFDIGWVVFNSLIFGFLSYSVLSDLIQSKPAIFIATAFAALFCSGSINSIKISYMKNEIERINKILENITNPKN